MQDRYPKVGDWVTLFTTKAHKYNINLVIKNNEIIAAYRDGVERIDNSNRANLQEVLDDMKKTERKYYSNNGVEEIDSKTFERVMGRYRSDTAPLYTVDGTKIGNLELLAIIRSEESQYTYTYWQPDYINIRNFGVDAIYGHMELKTIQKLNGKNYSLPIFPGCETELCSKEELLKYIYTNIKYPKEMRDFNEQGVMYLGITVGADGNISNRFEHIDYVNDSANKQLFMLHDGLKEKGKWQPRTQNGEAISTDILIPITFKIYELDSAILKAMKSEHELPLRGYDILFDEIVVVGLGSQSNAEHSQVNDKVYKVVQEMPRFPGCESTGGDKNAKKECADAKLIDFIYDNLEYPTQAKDNRIEGRVYIQFIVEKDGTLSGAKLVRDIGAGCGFEALRVVNLMNELCLLYTSPSPRDLSTSRMPSSA